MYEFEFKRFSMVAWREMVDIDDGEGIDTLLAAADDLEANNDNANNDNEPKKRKGPSYVSGGGL